MEKGTGTERQLFILSLLAQSATGYSISEIIERLDRFAGIEATRRVVARDLDYITQHFYVYEDVVNGVTVYKADKYELSKIDFSMSEVVALYFAREMMLSYEELNLADSAVQIIDRILSKMPEISKSALTEMKKNIKVERVHAPKEQIDEEILQIMTQAVTDMRKVRVVYHAFYHDRTDTREFEPYVLEVRDGTWHAIGFCHLRGAVRDLRLSRIIKAELLADTFDAPQSFYEEYRKKRFDKLAGEQAEEIRVLFHDEAARLVQEYHSYRADRLTPCAAGLTFEKHAAITPDLICWILSFGAGATVQHPPHLVERVRQETVKMTQRYLAEENQ